MVDWNPDEIMLHSAVHPLAIATIAMQVGFDSVLKHDDKSHWFDIEALICFFTHCMVYGDRETFLPAYERVQRLAHEVRELGWNEDLDRRCKALELLQNEVHEVYAHLFVQQG